MAFLFALFWGQEGHCATFKASFYSHASLVAEGTRKAGEAQIMANGRPFNENALTCASLDFPLGTILKITNKDNGRFIVVEVTDRIARRFKGKRVDLSQYAFSLLSPLLKGIISVDIEILP